MSRTSISDLAAELVLCRLALVKVILDNPHAATIRLNLITDRQIWDISRHRTCVSSPLYPICQTCVVKAQVQRVATESIREYDAGEHVPATKSVHDHATPTAAPIEAARSILRVYATIHVLTAIKIQSLLDTQHRRLFTKITRVTDAEITHGLSHSKRVKRAAKALIRECDAEATRILNLL